MDTKLPCGCYVAASLVDGVLPPSVWHCQGHAENGRKAEGAH